MPRIPTILIVEDEPAIRRLMARTLSDAGYWVVEAANGAAGLELLEAADPPIALVVTDTEMPRLDGRRLLRVVEQRWPAVRRLRTSGAFEVEPPAPGSAPAVLGKPFTPAELLERVRALLDEAAMPDER